MYEKLLRVMLSISTCFSCSFRAVLILVTIDCSFRDCETQITKIRDFETVQRVASPRFRDSCLESRDFETGRIFSETHDFR